MPVNAEISAKQWARYAYMRDSGHSNFVHKADKCERFFAGDQWSETDRARMRSVRRPALTINKILSTIANVAGEQIYNRAETTFRPRGDGNSETADALSKVFKQISDANDLDWKRSDMFLDGIITSRGFLDVRICYKDSMQGEVEIQNINPKNVIVDPDADQHDPDTWNDVITTKWLAVDEIATLYSRKDADLLRSRNSSALPYGQDSIDTFRDRFGTNRYIMYAPTTDQANVSKNIRIIDRQYRKLDRQNWFLLPETGDMRQIPLEWDQDRIDWYVKSFGFKIQRRLTNRIRWTVTADDVVLHDDWSPYKHYTVVPYFPFFRYGHTIGLVENLIGPQELLNKSSSQELHIINTTANSGWKVKTGTLQNMTVQELEEKGAQTGLVVEVNDMDDIEKITPNGVPSGLDRVSYKAEESIKTISGVSDSQQGQDRADVAAKAIQQKRQAASTNLVKPMDSLTRTDKLLAIRVLDLVQEFYTEERVMTITKNHMTGENEQFAVNSPTPEGNVVNDLTLGEYSVIVSSVPQRETLEDSQFDQAVSLRELGIQIPDSVVLEASRLQNKKQIMEQMAEAQNSPQAQAQAQLQQRAQVADISKTEAEAEQKRQDGALKAAKARKEMMPEQQEDNSAELLKVHQDGQLGAAKLQQQREEGFAKLNLQAQKQEADAQLKEQDLAQKRRDAAAKQAQEAAQAALKPTK